MQNQNNKIIEQNIAAYDDEINLIELWQVIWKRKVMIISITLVAAILTVVYVLSKPNIYRAEAILAPAGELGKKGGGAAALLGQFGGLASLAGISLGASSTEINLAVLKSRSFIKQVVKDNKLMPMLFPEKWNKEKKSWIENDPKKQPTLWNAYRKFKGALSVSTDKRSNLTTVSMVRKDPEEAAKWLQLLIETLNKHLKNQVIEEAEANIAYLEVEIEKTPLLEMRQTLYSVIGEQTKQIMLAKSKKYFAFKIIDAPEVPDRKVGNKLKMKTFAVVFTVAVFSILLAICLEFLWKKPQQR